MIRFLRDEVGVSEEMFLSSETPKVPLVFWALRFFCNGVDATEETELMLEVPLDLLVFRFCCDNFATDNFPLTVHRPAILLVFRAIRTFRKGVLATKEKSLSLLFPEMPLDLSDVL